MTSVRTKHVTLLRSLQEPLAPGLHSVSIFLSANGLILEKIVRSDFCHSPGTSPLFNALKNTIIVCTVFQTRRRSNLPNLSYACSVLAA